MDNHIEMLINKAKEQEKYLLSIRDSLIKRRIIPNDNITYRLERYRLIGMLDMLDVLRIDRMEFNWIF
jgi:hypothetical protein